MAKLGINFKIDVMKIDKTRLYKGEKGLYLNLWAVVDTDGIGEYGDHGIINQQSTKEEREQKVNMPILGNARILWSTLGNRESQEKQSSPPSTQEFDDDLPF